MEVTLNLNSYPPIKDIGYRRVENTWQHPDRKLDFNVFLYIVSGAFEVWEEGNEYVINEGEVFFLKSGLHHWGEPKTLPGTSWYWVHFYDRPEPLGMQLDCSSLEGTNGFLAPENCNRFVVLPKHMKLTTPRLITEKLDRLLKLYQTESIYRPFSLGMLAMDLFMDMHKQARNEIKASKSDVTVQKVITYIENNRGREISSEAISEELKMNYSYISNIFKKKTGISISEYSTKLKVFEAAKLLRETNFNISEISDRSRFQNAFYFSRVFKKVMGVSPSEYIKQIYRA